MTKDEAIGVIGIMLEADGGCSHCVGSLLDDFNKAGFGWHVDVDAVLDYESDLEDHITPEPDNL